MASPDLEISQLAHEHVFLGANHDANTRRTLWVVVLTGAMMVVEILAGTIFNSMALLADGFHMATHAGALGIAALAYVFAKRHARNPRFTFGTGKVGDLAGFASALVLALIALGIGVESFSRLLEPRPVAFLQATVVAVIGLAVNIASALLLGAGHEHGHGHHHGHAHDHGNHHHHDNNLRSAYVHVLADALTSVLAIAALLGGRYLGWVWLDPVMGIVGSIVIAVWSWNLLRDTAAVLLDTGNPDIEQEVRLEVEGPGDTLITDLHVWRLGPDAHAAIVSVTGVADTETVRARLIRIHELSHLTVERR
ncbi:CDF family Co(II)/Ni(II) efflux transporter DmeF [Croceicoccus naphthovorans]|uniref:Cation transporter n=1 Tax=Croceicoccus naphthovorans TaxID=1348774 RepID=A0A0G3XEP6_9SPHN|nr:CDF family Co(II)/Ni(II) efflux transporter DmeF [Croceicoccus naphthovorans]AKM09101.1 cation transporter [Croceicoccus naphthovorans]MBB3991655.1 cation diffusion facilitator family transporter [Croceicoccus naphthovorans]